jgi:hypothetical protein
MFGQEWHYAPLSFTFLACVCHLVEFIGKRRVLFFILDLGLSVCKLELLTSNFRVVSLQKVAVCDQLCDIDTATVGAFVCFRVSRMVAQPQNRPEWSAPAAGTRRAGRYLPVFALRSASRCQRARAFSWLLVNWSRRWPVFG